MVLLAGVALLVLSAFGFYLNSVLLILMLLPGLFIMMIAVNRAPQ